MDAVIPFLDLQAQYQSLEQEIDAAVKGVFASGAFVMGAEVVQFEREFAAHHGCEYGLGVASGTDALRLALRVLEIGPGDEVITTPFTFQATASAILHCGGTVVFADVDPRTFNLDPASVEAAVTPRTKAILPVHLYGQPAAMPELLRIAQRHGLKVVEDCAQAAGATCDARPVGSFGELSTFSFYPTKNLGGAGDGGMVLTSDPALRSKIDLLRRHGGDDSYRPELLGYNSRLDSLQAAVLRVKLRHLDGWTERRRALALRYDEMLAEFPVQRPRVLPNCRHAYHQYTVVTPHRDALAQALKRRGIESRIYYPVVLHRTALFRDAIRSGSLEIAERLSEEVLSLPLYPELIEAQQNQVVSSIGEFFTEEAARR